jgi:hypothetical protein
MAELQAHPWCFFQDDLSCSTGTVTLPSCNVTEEKKMQRAKEVRKTKRTEGGKRRERICKPPSEYCVTTSVLSLFFTFDRSGVNRNGSSIFFERATCFVLLLPLVIVDLLTSLTITLVCTTMATLGQRHQLAIGTSLRRRCCCLLPCPARTAKCKASRNALHSAPRETHFGVPCFWLFPTQR